MFIRGDSKEVLSHLPDNFVDLIVTDPPYGISFMGKDWDKALPDIEVWKQCYRVLKEGKLAFIMCSPRQDVLSRMIIILEDAGFKTGYTSIYWTYASGFPKAANISKLIDKRNGRTENERKELANYLKSKIQDSKFTYLQIREYLGHSLKGGGLVPHWVTQDVQPTVPTLRDWNKMKEILDLDNRFDELIERIEAEREIIGKGQCGDPAAWYAGNQSKKLEYNITKPATDEAKKMEGAYVGFQPKPAVEVILVVSKGKTLTWLDDCRIPYQSEDAEATNKKYASFANAKDVIFDPQKGWNQNQMHRLDNYTTEKGRFPANLLVSDDVLNDGKNHKTGGVNDSWGYGVGGPNSKVYGGGGKKYHRYTARPSGEEGSYSRYFDLDKWYSTFPFIITPKASKSERNEGCEDLPERLVECLQGNKDGTLNKRTNHEPSKSNNFHPTVKPIKLMSYLITLGSRENDLVLDPFVGSGTTYKACLQTHRRCIGIEINHEYIEIAKARVKPLLQQTRLV